MIEQEDKPKWLLELENKKRKPRLAHETGAGAPCLNCDSICPGLDLHFWRKICKNCKCSGGDHDVDDDEFPQFELLFGPNIKHKKNRSFLLRVNDKKQMPAETPFEWIPPDTTKELAADYMKALPTEKLPIKGSTGAAFRKQQLQKQLPLHDMDYKACDGLNEEERKHFQKYLNNLKQCAGQGKVAKLTTIKPFDRSLMTPANATDVQRLNPQNSQKLLNSNVGLSLRTPSSFIVKSSKLDTKLDIQNLLNDNKNALSVNVDEDKVPHSRPTNEPNKQFHNKCIFPIFSNDKNGPLPSHIDVLRTQHYQATSDGNPHPAQNYPPCSSISNNTNIPSSSGTNLVQPRDFRTANEINRQRYRDALADIFNNWTAPQSACESELLISEIFPPLDSSNQKNHALRDDCIPYELKHSKTPSTIAKEECAQNSAIHSINTPFINSRVENEKSNQKMKENIEYSKNLPSNVLVEQMFSEASNSCSVNGNDNLGNNLDKQELLHSQKKPNDKYCTKNYSQTSAIPREISTQNYNPSVSNSEEKKRNLEKSNILESKSTNYSENCKNQVPSGLPYNTCRTAAQAELNISLPVQSNIIQSEKLNNQIFPDHAISASVVLQHLDNVHHLQEELEGMAINVSKAQNCYECKEDIFCGDVVVTAEKMKDAVWHPGCFVCSACNELLVDLVYFTYKGKLYCGRDLAELLEIPRCFACDELIFVRESTVAEGHNYHVKHFCCWDCDIPLAGKQYISENDRPLCIPCYQNNYAKTCNACNNAIAADQQGVAVKNLNFHVTNDCFCCFTCKKSLLQGQIAIKENKPFCSRECITEFLHQLSSVPASQYKYIL